MLVFAIALLLAQTARASPEISVHDDSGISGAERVSNAGAHVFRNYPTGTSSAPQVFTISNAGSTTLTLAGITLSGPGSDQFILDTTSLDNALAPGDTTSFTIVFRPTRVGLLQTVVRIASNDADESLFGIHLAGTGQSSAARKVVAWGDSYLGKITVPPGLTDVAGIAAGYFHSVALKGDGTVVAWGWNGSGGTSVPQGLNGVVAISTAAASHNLALKSDGTVVAWGWNGSGQTTVPPGLTGVVAVSAGGYHSLALKRDGTVAAWGWNGSGESTVPSGLSGVVAVAAGGYHSLALKWDGTVVAWGWNGNGETTVPSDLSNVTAVSAGWDHNLAMLSDGRVVGWGGSTSSSTPITGLLTGVQAVSAGKEFSLAVKTDGTVVAWGDNTWKQSTVPASLKNVTAVAAGVSHSLALGEASDIVVHAGPEDGGIRLTSGEGAQDLGLAFAGGTGGTSTFTVSNAGLADLTLSPPSLTGSATTEFRLDTSGMETTLAPGATTTFTVTFCPLSRGTKTAVLRLASNAPQQNPFLIPLSALCTSSFTIHAGSDAGSPALVDHVGMHVFRSHSVGAVAIPQIFVIRNVGTTPLSLGGVSLSGGSHFRLDTSGLASSVAPGESTSFSISFSPMSPGIQRGVVEIAGDNALEIPFRIPLAGIGLSSLPRTVVAWGSNTWGQRTVPPGLNDVMAVAAGDTGSLALKSDGSVVAWGSQGAAERAVPAGLNSVVSVAAGGAHALALKRDGTVVGWGATANGEGSVPPGLNGVVAVAAGQRHSLALKGDGTVVTWGWNGHAQSYLPAGLRDVVGIAAGSSHSLALKNDGTVVAWAGSVNEEAAMVPAGLNRVVAVAASDDYSLALKSDGTVVEWGGGWFYPAPPGLSGVMAVAAGNRRAMALKSDGSVVTWGLTWLYETRAPVGLTGVTAVSAGQEHYMALGQTAPALSQSITFDPPATLYLGQTVRLTPWASSGLPVALWLDSATDKVSLSQGLLTAKGVGTIKIHASQWGGGRYPAVTVVRTITIKGPPATLTLLNLTQTYDGSPKLISVIGTAGVPVITYNGAAEAPTNAGKYAVKATVVAGGKTTLASGTLTIHKAPLRIIAQDQRRLVNQPNPQLTFTCQGYVGSDNAATLSTQPAVTTTARTTSAAGTYPIITKGGLAANYTLIHVPGNLVVDGFGMNYEALLSDVNGRAAGKLEVTLNAACTSFTAKVANTQDTVPVSFAGSMAINVPMEQAEGAKTLPTTKNGVACGLSFTISRNGKMSAAFTRAANGEPGVIFQSLDGHGRLLRPKAAGLVSYAGAHTLLLEPAVTAPGMPAPSSPLPGGSGWARAIVSSAGVLTLTGVLGDGTSFTATLPPDTSAEPGYRFFLQPYKPARTGAFLGGAFAMAAHPSLQGRRLVGQAILHGAKAAGATDVSYPDGFADLDTVFILDPWQVSPLSKTPASLRVNHSTTGSQMHDASLPAALTLNGTRLGVPDANNNPTKWLGTLNAATGQLTGSFELVDAGNKKRVVKFTGILRQPALPDDALIGGGHFVLPPPLGTSGQKLTTGDLMFLKPAEP